MNKFLTTVYKLPFTIDLVIGDFINTNITCCMKNFFQTLNTQHYLNNKDISKFRNINLRHNYLINIDLNKNIENLNTILCIATDISNSLPILIYRLKLHVTEVFNICWGSNDKITENSIIIENCFNITHKVLKLIRGKHNNSNIICNINDVIILIGNIILCTTQIYFFTFDKLLTNFIKRTNLITSSINYLTINPTTINLFELNGHTIFNRKCSIYNNLLDERRILISFNSSDINYRNKYSFAARLTHHFHQTASTYDIELPTLSPYETTGYYINIMGYSQLFKRSTIDVPAYKTAVNKNNSLDLTHCIGLLSINYLLRVEEYNHKELYYIWNYNNHIHFLNLYTNDQSNYINMNFDNTSIFNFIITSSYLNFVNSDYISPESNEIVYNNFTNPSKFHIPQRLMFLVNTKYYDNFCEETKDGIKPSFLNNLNDYYYTTDIISINSDPIALNTKECETLFLEPFSNYD